MFKWLWLWLWLWLIMFVIMIWCCYIVFNLIGIFFCLLTGWTTSFQTTTSSRYCLFPPLWLLKCSSLSDILCVDFCRASPLRISRPGPLMARPPPQLPHRSRRPLRTGKHTTTWAFFALILNLFLCYFYFQSPAGRLQESDKRGHLKCPSWWRVG